MRSDKSNRKGEVAPASLSRRIEGFLTQKRVYTVAAILLLSVSLRVGYFLNLTDGPLVWQHRWDQSDMNFFDRWAHEILAGDLLSRNVLHPLHSWHNDVAQVYFQQHPREKQVLEAAGKPKGMDATRMLWEQWLGGGASIRNPSTPTRSQ